MANHNSPLFPSLRDTNFRDPAFDLTPSGPCPDCAPGAICRTLNCERARLQAVAFAVVDASAAAIVEAAPATSNSSVLSDTAREQIETLERLVEHQKTELGSLKQQVADGNSKLAVADSNLVQAQDRCGDLADDLAHLNACHAKLVEQRDALLIERKSLQHQLEKLGAAFIRFATL